MNQINLKSNSNLLIRKHYINIIIILNKKKKKYIRELNKTNYANKKIILSTFEI